MAPLKDDEEEDDDDEEDDEEEEEEGGGRGMMGVSRHSRCSWSIFQALPAWKFRARRNRSRNTSSLSAAAKRYRR